MKPYQYKSGSPQSGNAWTDIASDLCAVKEITFNVNQKSVRDRYRLLIEKHKKKMRAQEGVSGSSAVETELDQLLQNIMEESQEASENYDKQTKEKQEKDLKQRKDAEEVRQRALESLAQTEKRHADEGSQLSSSRTRPKKSGSETMLYLESKAEKEFDLRKEELRIKKEEMELQKELQLETTRKQTTATENMVKIVECFQTQQVNLQQQMLQQQQQFQMMMQQQSQLFMSVIEKLSKN